MNLKNLSLLVQFFIFSASILNLRADNNKPYKYPEIKSDSSIDIYYTKKVIDSYRNLENLKDKRVLDWIKKENEFYDTIINSLSIYDSIKSVLDSIQEKKKTWFGYVRIGGNRKFFVMGNTNEDVKRFAFVDNEHNEPIELFNTIEIEKKFGKKFNVSYFEPSPDGKFFAFGLYASGNEKSIILIIDVEKRKLLSDTIKYSTLGNIQWMTDNSGFFYTKDKDLITQEDSATPYEDSKVQFHKLNTNPKTDRVICSRNNNKELGLDKTDWPVLFVFPNSTKILLNIYSDFYNTIYYADLKEIFNEKYNPLVWKKICDKTAMITTNLLFNDIFYAISFKNNSNGQIIEINLPDTSSRVIYESKGTSIDELITSNKKIYFSTNEKGTNRLYHFEPNKLSPKEIKLPFSGSLRLSTSFNCNPPCQPNNNIILYMVGYTKQWSNYLCDNNGNLQKEEHTSKEIKYFDPMVDLTLEEIEIPSYDGSLVPLSIIYDKKTKLNGKNPTIIEAYGAFGISLKPEFKRNRLVWYKNGGIYAVAHVRGGSEKGSDWYKQGFKSTKANSWKDLIACSEYLISKGYTSKMNLALMGASAGAITVGRALTERPDLYKAAVILAGTLNTVRLENFINNSTIPEFGTVKDSVEFNYLFDMDTYLHIKEGIKYPSILFSAGFNDARVAVWQPAKTVARFQSLKQSDNIILFRVQDQGHFDYPSDADTYSFLFWQLGH